MDPFILSIKLNYNCEATFYIEKLGDYSITKQSFPTFLSDSPFFPFTLSATNCFYVLVLAFGEINACNVPFCLVHRTYSNKL